MILMSHWTDLGDRVLGRRECGLSLAAWVEELLGHAHKEMIVASFARLRLVWRLVRMWVVTPKGAIKDCTRVEQKELKHVIFFDAQPSSACGHILSTTWDHASTPQPDMVRPHPSNTKHHTVTARQRMLQRASSAQQNGPASLPNERLGESCTKGPLVL